VPDIRLIATDLDGTLIGSANEFALYQDFKARLNELRRKQAVYWVACTGRTRPSFNEFFHPMRSMGLTPDFIIIRHAYIYHHSPVGYIPRVFWNLHIYHEILRLHYYGRDALQHWRGMITGAAVGVRMVDRRRDELRLQFDSEEAAVAAGHLLREKLEPFRHLRVFTYLREVDVKPVPFTKGLALAELAGHLDVPPDNILTIGNGHNDISMFDPEVSALTGCPANSEAEVMRVVHERGGHIAAGRALTGVMQILDAYRNDAVNSELPEWWVPTPEMQNPSKRHRRHPHHRRSKKQLQQASVWLIAGIVSVTVVVFAHFGLIPFSDTIMKPFYLLMQSIEKALEAFYSNG